MDTKTEYMVAKRATDGSLIPMHWTSADDERAPEGIKNLRDEFNEDEQRIGKTAQGDPANFVMLKVTTTFEVIE